MSAPPEELEVGVRAWAIPDYLRYRNPRGSGRQYVDLGPSDWTLIFDTETTVDESQRLRVGAYQIRRGHVLKGRGFFYEPGELTGAELQLLHAHAGRLGSRVMTREQFMETVFFLVAWSLRGVMVGHNLPFDISRLAIGHAPAKSRDGSMRGGFTFQLSKDERWPRIQVKPISAKAAFIRFAVPKGRHPEQRNP